MNKSTILKMVIAGFSLAVLSGCANTRAIEADQLNVETGYIEAKSNGRLTDNIKVETENFKGTTKIYLSPNSMPALDNENAKKAIEKVLREYNFSNSNGDYTLFAKITRNHTGTFTTTRENTINYKLVNNLNNEVVFDKDVESKGKVSIAWHKHIIGNSYETAHRSGRDSLEKNFKKLIQLLNDYQ